MLARISACSTRDAALETDPLPQELVMATAAHEINWQHDVDQAIAEAGRTHRPLLLDFTAAPL
jgi:hypothetical protein